MRRRKTLAPKELQVEGAKPSGGSSQTCGCAAKRQFRKLQVRGSNACDGFGDSPRSQASAKGSCNGPSCVRHGIAARPRCARKRSPQSLHRLRPRTPNGAPARLPSRGRYRHDLLRGIGTLSGLAGAPSLGHPLPGDAGDGQLDRLRASGSRGRSGAHGPARCETVDRDRGDAGPSGTAHLDRRYLGPSEDRGGGRTGDRMGYETVPPALADALPE